LFADIDAAVRAECGSVWAAAQIGYYLYPAVPPDATERPPFNLDYYDGSVGQNDWPFRKIAVPSPMIRMTSSPLYRQLLHAVWKNIHRR